MAKIMSLQFIWSKTSKTHRIVSEKPCCNIFYIPVHPKSAIKQLNFIKKTSQYFYTANRSSAYNKTWHIPSILCIIKLLCLQTISNNYKNQYLKQTKYHKLNVVTALIRQNTFVIYKRETRTVTNDNHYNISFFIITCNYSADQYMYKALVLIS